MPIEGIPMFILVQKWRRFKPVLKQINKLGFNDIVNTDSKAAQDLKACQIKLGFMPIHLILS